MNTHARRGEAAYSFTELLITIVIAGIAFAAMVPVFVAAQQTGPKDKYRTTATNIAQDRIERIRQLPFSVVTTDDLLDPPEGSGLAEQLEWGDVVVDGKHYTVTPVATSVDAQNTTVTVTVAWTEPPNSTEREVVLRTTLFRQLPGPQIIDVEYSPTPNTSGWITSVPMTGIVITATVNPAQAVDVGRVKFTIVSMAGTSNPIIEFKSTPDVGTTNRYSYTWSAGTALPDGLYKVSVVAYSTATDTFPAEQGNTRESTVRIETSTPPAVPSVNVYAGKVSPVVVNLLWTWNVSLAPDWDHFEVWRRSAAADGTWALVGDDIRSYGYRDTAATGLTAGAAYLYVVRVVDTGGNALDPSVLTAYPATPTASGAASAPSAPRTLSLSFAGGAMTALWTPPASTTGVVGYHVYRSANAAHTDAALIASAIGGYADYRVYDDRLSWGTVYYYTVKSFNADGAESNVASLATGQPGDASGWAQYTTPAAPQYTLRVYVKGITSKKPATVTIKNTDTNATVGGSPFTLTSVAPSKDVALPFGVYTVTMTAGTTTKTTNASLTGDSSKTVYVTFVL